MNAERWQRVQLLFEEALAQPEESRVAFVKSACEGDAGLRDEVSSLLDAHERSTGAGLPTVWLVPLASPRAARFAPGDRVGGRYRIEDLLGCGGMGEVYEAWDDQLSIGVALKTLHVAGGSREALHRLKLEGLLARSVWHPNVCRVYDIGRHGKGKATVWFLTMELLRGRTLSERLLEEGRLPLDRALRFADQMAAGLGAAHRAGVVHRDFKPSNVVLVVRDGGEQAVVTDFGIAKVASPEEGDLDRGAAAIRGTPAYMAPEQVQGQEVGPAADLYALGVVLYEMVTGTLPFAGGSSIEIARRRLEEEPPSPRRVVPDLDERWEATILRSLARDPRQRFGQAEEVADALSGRVRVETVRTRDLAARTRHALPGEQDPFVGREEEIAVLQRHLAGDAHLVTLVGAGGMGKTRLAVHHGWQGLDGWPGGVWFCDLTQARNVSGIVSTVARSLGVQLGRGDPVQQLGRAIAGRGRCLVILDNFEQVAGHARETVGRWLEQAAEARFLATSRERLGLGGENVQAVEPLSIETGIELFTARARGLRPGLELVGAEAEAAREIVRLVDGMPLAIELAGARMRVMSAAQIVAQMRRRFELLTGGRSAHHETLQGTIDGSWELLRPWEKAAWAQCGVFDGGFTLEAARAVLDLGALRDHPWVVDVLQSLVDKSLLWTSAPGGNPVKGPEEVRFGMYVSLQEYARMKLRQKGVVSDGRSGPAAERAAEERHGKWYAQYGTTEAIEALDQHGGVDRRRRLERDLPNLLSACRRALQRRDGATAVAAYRASAEVLASRGPFATAAELGRDVLRETRLAGAEKALLLWALGRAERLAGRMDEAIARSEEALALAREANDRRLEGVLTGWLGVLHHDLGEREQSRARYEAALAVHREVGDRRHEAIVLGNLGILFHIEGRLEEARSHYEAALAIHREGGDRGYEGSVLSFLGALRRAQGRLEEALGKNEAALAILREVGYRSREGQVLGNMGNLHVELGRFEEARAHLQAALAIAREVGDVRNEGLFLGNLGNLHYEQGQLEEARTCYEAAVAIHSEVGTRQMEAVARGSLGRLLHRTGQTEPARDALSAAEAILRQVDSGLELAKLLCFRAEVEFASGDLARAQAVLGEADALARQSGAGPDSELGRMVARLHRAPGLESAPASEGAAGTRAGSEDPI